MYELCITLLQINQRLLRIDDTPSILTTRFLKIDQSFFLFSLPVKIFVTALLEIFVSDILYQNN